MTKRSWALIGTSLGGVLAVIWLLASPLAKMSAADTKDAIGNEKPAKEMPSVFGLTRLHELHIEFTAKEWERMQQVTGGMRMGFPGAPQPPAAPKPEPKPGEEPLEKHKNAAFGLEFPWAHGILSEDGKTYKNVGVRYKGNASYMASSRGLKRNFKIELDHYDDEQRYNGLKTINLNAGAMDPTRAREVISYAIFRAAGVAAPRTAFAQVTLTVPGKYDKELVGLYTFVEQVDKTFLKDRFKNNKGVLMKPERLRGLDYLGEDWDKYKDRYQPKHEPTKKESQRIIDFVRLVNKGTDEQFNKEIASYLDVDSFLRFVAVNALVVNLDSYLMLGHNYYLYLNPETSKFVFIPWDLDLSLAGFPMAGSTEQQTDLSLMHPYPGTNKLIDRLLAIKEVNDKYQRILKDLSTTCFSKEMLLKDLNAIEKLTKEPLEKEKKAVAARKEGGGGFGFGPPGGMFGQRIDLRQFVEKRTESVVAQLDSKSKGYIPTMGFGPGGPGGRPGGRPGGFGPGNFMAKPLIESLDTDKDGKLSREEFIAGAKKFFADCDKDSKGSIDEKALVEGFNRIFPAPPGFGPPGGAAPGAPQGGARPGGGNVLFGPGIGIASAVIKRAGVEKDGKLTLDKFLAAAESYFAECDKDKKGKLDESAVATGINLLMPPPPGFGPPGGQPGGVPPERKPDASKESPKDSPKESSKEEKKP